jgi:hypothetical protein
MTTKKGKLKYFFSMKRDGTPVEKMPEGYEIYENPNARVFLRRIQPQMISDMEVGIVRQGMNRFSHLSDCRIDVKKNVITVFTPDQDRDTLASNLNNMFGIHVQHIKAIIEEIHYSPVMRFILVDEVERKFVAERYCFLGSIDDWIDIGESGTLHYLVRKVLKHLGKESFYDLM